MANLKVDNIEPNSGSILKLSPTATDTVTIGDASTNPNSTLAVKGNITTTGHIEIGGSGDILVAGTKFTVDGNNGNVTSTGNITADGTVTGGDITTAGTMTAATVTATGSLTVAGDLVLPIVKAMCTFSWNGSNTATLVPTGSYNVASTVGSTAFCVLTFADDAMPDANYSCFIWAHDGNACTIGAGSHSSTGVTIGLSGVGSCDVSCVFLRNP